MSKLLWTLSLALFCSNVAQAQTSEPAQTPEPGDPQPAAQISIDPYQAYAEGRFADAFDGFANLQVKRPKDVDLMLNLGASLYRLHDYAGADKAWALAAEHGDPNVRAHALYDLGNSAFQQKHLKEAVEHFEGALSLKPDDDDAQHNLRVAKKQLELEQQDKPEPKNQDPNAPKDPQDPNQANASQPQDPNHEGAQDPNAQGQPKPDSSDDDKSAEGHDKQEPKQDGHAAEPKTPEAAEPKEDDAQGKDGKADAAQQDTGDDKSPHDAKRMPRSQAERLLDAMGESRPRHAPPGGKAGQRPPDGMDW